MTIENIGAVVIGAGVIGLACARELSMHGIETLIIERHDGIGQEISSRNSEVIHAGLYYPPDSLKASLCVKGNRALYNYCAQRGIAHKRCGKLIVATTPAQEDKLAQLLDQARSNGVADVRMITRKEAVALEPQLSCTAALLSPATGIIDSHALMLSLLGDAENHGATLALRSEVSRAEVTPGGILLQIISGDEETTLEAKIVINSAGLSRSGACIQYHRTSSPTPTAGLLRQGQLFLPVGPRAVFSADLPHPRAWRTGCPPHARPRRPSPLRP
jgi:L-2-hydroxyglutarate oxidase LhgO